MFDNFSLVRAALRLIPTPLLLLPILTFQLPAADTKPKPDSAPEVTASAPSSSDLILKAMKDELDRSRQLALSNLDTPYYIEYSLDDAQNFAVSASLGGVLLTSQNRFRLPRTHVRVGDYAFDNTHHVYSDYYSGSRYDPEQFPLDDNYSIFRRDLWLATDRAYKGATEAIGRKRADLKNINQTQDLPDFSKTDSVQKLLPITRQSVDTARWIDRTKKLSTIFSKYPSVLSSQVTFDGMQSTHYFANSEGTVVRSPDSVFSVQIKASGQAPDGMVIRDSVVIPVLDVTKLPADAALQKLATEVAENVKALSAAPTAESYSGPVLFEGIAGAQLFAELLGPNLTLPRKPIGSPGRPVQFLASDFEGRIGSKVLPEFIDIVDDPTQTSFAGAPLFGQYVVDDEGVLAKPVKLVEKGKLQNFLLTREPVKGFPVSNGHARLPGAYGTKVAAPSNLFIKASETVKADELKKRLVDLVKQRNKPYGIIVRKMDYPSSASVEELRRIASSAAQSGGTVRLVSIPLLVYRIYPDGREELVRGLRMRGLNTRSLKDISAASEETYTFNFMYNQAPFALMGAGGFVSPESVIAPAILFEDLDLEKPQEDLPKPSLVPPPPLS